jgi:pyrrolidone-carboxylate peptidase
MRVLLIGFGPFPGAPLNPSALLVKSLARRRRPAFAEIVRTSHVFTTTYAAVDRDLAKLREIGADIVLMFGLAGRRRHLCIETRARNAVSLLFPDASGFRPQRGVIAPGEPAALCGAAPFARLLGAVRSSAVRCRAMPAAICATTPIGERWSRRALAGRWCSSFIFRAFSAVCAGGGLDADHPGSTPSLRLANASSLRSSRQAAVNRAGRIVTCAEPECGSATA